MGFPISYNQSTQVLPFMMVSSTNHVIGITGLTPTVTLSKNGGGFADCAGTVSEIGNGWYCVAANPADSNTLGPLLLHASAAGCDPFDDLFPVVAYNSQASADLGLTAIPMIESAIAAVESSVSNPIVEGFTSDALFAKIIVTNCRAVVDIDPPQAHCRL